MSISDPLAQGAVTGLGWSCPSGRHPSRTPRRATPADLPLSPDQTSFGCTSGTWSKGGPAVRRPPRTLGKARHAVDRALDVAVGRPRVDRAQAGDRAAVQQ